MTNRRLYMLMTKKSQRRSSMTGFALWDVLLLVALIASIFLAIFLIQQSRVQLRTVQERNASLLWADNKVAGFAAANLRLPCPDSNNDGSEDCGAISGTLPYLTMGLYADAAVRGAQKIKYSVLAAAATDLDLRVLDSQFEPFKWDSANSNFGDNYAYGAVNGLDFCLKLEKTLDYENVPDPRNGVTGVGNASAVAYSLAVAQRQGIPDLTRSRNVSNLANALGCLTTMSSVNAISLAVEVVNEVQDEQASIRDSAIIMIAFNVFNIAMAALDVAMAGVGLASAITTLSVASGLLATAIGTCIVLVGCAFIPVYTAAVVAASIAIGLFAAGIVASALAIGALVYSTVLAVEVAIATGINAGNTTPSVDLAAQLVTVQQAEAQATANELAATNAYNAMQQDTTDRTNALNNVTAARNVYDPTGTRDVQLNAAIAASDAHNLARVAKNNAEGAVTVHVHLVFHGAHFQAGRIGRFDDGPFVVRHVTKAVFCPAQGNDAFAWKLAQNVLANRAVHDLAGMVIVAEQKGNVDNFDLRHKVADRASGGVHDVQRPQLNGFRHLALATERGAWEMLAFVAVLRAFFNLVAKDGGADTVMRFLGRGVADLHDGLCCRTGHNAEGQ